jgi:predicted membrane protein
MGVGECHLDLRGEPKKDYSVQVHGGVGEAEIYLPTGVGVVARAGGGIGEIEIEGDLRKDGGEYVNSQYGKSPVTVRVDVKGGVGSIKLIG